MAETSSRCLQLVVQKLDTILPIDRIVHSHYSGECGIVCLSDDKGCVSFLNLPAALLSTNVLGKVKSFGWQTNSNDRDEDFLAPKFCVISQDGSMSVHTIAYQLPSLSKGDTNIQQVSTCLSTCPLQTLKSILHDDGIDYAQESAVGILQFSPASMLLLIERKHIIKLEVSGSRPPLVESFYTLGAESRQAHVIGDILLSLDDSHVISVHNLNTGQEYARVDTVSFCKNSNMDICSIKCFEITKDFQNIVFLDDNNVMYTIDLNKYFNDFPQHSTSVAAKNNASKLCQDLDRVVGSQMASTKIGDAFWQQELAKHHRQEMHKMDQQSWCHNLPLPNECKVVSSSDKQRSKFNTLFSSVKQEQYGSLSRNSPTLSLKLKGEHKGSVLKKTVQTLSLGSVLPGCVVKSMSTRQSCVSLWCSYHDVGAESAVEYLVIYDVKENSVVYHPLTEECLVVMNTDVICPPLILTHSAVSTVVVDTSQEELVNRMMVFESATFADCLCRLNQWDRCAIPLRALEVGLRHRQLDIVKFFLKNRENIFKSRRTSHNSGLSPQKSLSSPLGAPNLSSPSAGDLSSFIVHPSEEFEQVLPVIKLLALTIKTNINDTSSKQFGEQLLQISLDYLHRVVQNAVSALNNILTGNVEDTHSMRGELENALETLTDYVEELRQFLQQGVPSSSRSSKISSSLAVYDTPPNPYTMTQLQEEVTAKWKTMSIQDIVSDAIVMSNIPLVQTYLRQCGEEHEASWDSIISIGLQQVLRCLSCHQMELGCQLLSNMGFDVNSKLRQICFYTTDRKLQDYLTNELTNKHSLSEEELSMVTFLHKLQAIYSHDESQGHLKVSTWSDVLSEDTSPHSTHSDLMDVGLVMLEWIRTWDPVTRQRIILEAEATSGGVNSSECPSNVLWEYLLSHNDWSNVRDWIVESFAPKTGKVSKWRESLTLPVVSLLQYCTPSFKEKVLDELSRHGVFTSEELRDFSLLLHRLSRRHNAIALPHPLDACHESHDCDLLDYHASFIGYCVDHHLPDVLYFYMDHFNLGLDEASLIALQLNEHTCHWLDMMVKFRMVARDLQDPNAVFQASLSNAGYMLGMNRIAVMTLIDRGCLVQALTSMMYAPYSMEKILSGEVDSDVFKVDGEPLRQALGKFPKLQAALFPNSSQDGSTSQDISVYQLLMHNAPFDPSKLFGWQSTNVTATGECVRELPHFAQQDLVDKFAHRDRLGFLYYLRQGRPSFAFTALISQLMEGGATNFSTKKVSLACQKAHQYAIQYFNDPFIPAACVVFTELLGRESTLLRVHIEVANTILSHMNNQPVSKARKEAEKLNQADVVSIVMKCVMKKRKFAMQVLPVLEEAVKWQLERKSIIRTSNEASLRWHVVIIYCQLHGLPMTTTFLTECAVENNWLMFLYFSQIHQYPKKQLLELLSKFKSSHLREHLEYVIENAHVQSIEDIKDKLTMSFSQKSINERDFRASFLSVVGVQKLKETGGTSSSEDDVVTSAVSETSNQQNNEHPMQEQITVNKELIPKDMFGVLFNCLCTSLPWRALLTHAVLLRNPVLAVLAACYKECPIEDSQCIWLVMNADYVTCEEILQSVPSPEYHSWSTDNLTDICMVYCRKQWTATLLNSFQIFHKDSPLLPFLAFYSQLEERNMNDCQRHLEDFKELFYKCQRSKDLDSQVSWTGKIAVKMLKHALLMEESSYYRLSLLRLLDQANIYRALSSVDDSVPDFNKLCQLQQIAHSCTVSVNFTHILDSEEVRLTECDRVLSLLQSKHMYSESRTFAAICGLPRDDITIAEMTWELERASASSMWKEMTTRCQYWNKCTSAFDRHQVLPEKAAHFFEAQIPATHSNEEKLLICQLAFDWLTKSTDDDTVLSDLQLKIWHCQLQIHMEKVESNGKVKYTESPSFTDTVSDAAELIHCGKMPRMKDVHTTTLTDKELLGFGGLLDQLLDNGRICEACKLAVQFDHYSQDLAIILTCIRLATEVETTDDIDEHMKKLLATDSKRRPRQLSMSHPGLSRTASSASLLSTVGDLTALDADDTLVAMEKLQQHCRLGQRCCSRIITLYKISRLLEADYCDVVMEAPYSILKQILMTTSEMKYTLARSFIESSSLATDEVAGFLAQGIVQSLEMHAHGVPTNPQSSKALIYNPSSVDSKHDLTHLIRLCLDPSLIGSRLVDSAAAMSADCEQPVTVFSMQVEMLICAHECYTLACNMEGISSILRAARLCTVNLGQAEEFALMIRLLTGVGRFSEMTYIFDTLKQSHQFELLFRKGMEKEDRLKLAILEYLKRYPGDTDTYTMVSLHFTMYREIAQLLEDAAYKHLKMFVNRQLDSSCEATLHNIVQYFSDAAESYVKEECLRHAQNCVKQARLVALQIHMLSSATPVINLTTPQAVSFIINHTKFYEAYIVAEAYNKPSEWASAIYQQVVVNNDLKYLQDLKGHVKLTTSIISEVAEKFRREQNRSNQMTANMRKVLNHCNEVVVRYKLAHDLGYQDIISELMKGDARAYLQDVISRQDRTSISDL